MRKKKKFQDSVVLFECGFVDRDQLITVTERVDPEIATQVYNTRIDLENDLDELEGLVSTYLNSKSKVELLKVLGEDYSDFEEICKTYTNNIKYKKKEIELTQKLLDAYHL